MYKGYSKNNLSYFITLAYDVIDVYRTFMKTKQWIWTELGQEVDNTFQEW